MSVFNLSIGALRQQDTSAEAARRAAQQHLASLPQRATWMWTDGSADGGVRNGGAGAYIEWPDGLEVFMGQIFSPKSNPPHLVGSKSIPPQIKKINGASIPIHMKVRSVFYLYRVKI